MGYLTKAPPPPFFRRQSLVLRAALLCGSVSLLLLGEFILAVMFSRSIDRSMFEFTNVDRRSQALLAAAGKMSDFSDDLLLPDGIPSNLQPTLAHWRGHLIALSTVEAEMRRQGRAVSTPAVGDLLQKLSEVQLEGTRDAFGRYAHEIRAVIDVLGRETLQMVTSVDAERVALGRALVQTRQTYISWMLGMAVVGTTLTLAAGIAFMRDLTQRLHLLRDKAAVLAHGDVSDPLPIRVRDELGEVTEAINYMAKKIADREGQLEELRLRFTQQEKMQALGIFATGMAHEIGNPIQAISALSYQVSENLAQDPGLESVQANIMLVDSIGSHANRLARTISEIREFAHPGRPEFEAVDVNEVVRATVGLMRFDPRFKRKTLTVDCRAVDSVISAVQDNLVQVVVNLLTNAADAVEDNGGSVSLVTMDTADGVVISVADTGSGMPEQVRARACDPFFTTKSRAKGTGMGLAICHSIVVAHGGSLTIASAEGCGTTISVTLPRGQLS